MTTEQHLELVKLMEIALKKCNWLVKEEFRTVLHELTVRQHMFIAE